MAGLSFVRRARPGLLVGLLAAAFLSAAAPAFSISVPVPRAPAGLASSWSDTPFPLPPWGRGEGSGLSSTRCGIAWGILPIAANEYWRGSNGHCPYAHCGEPYSFVRNPSQLPPFSSTDGGLTWERNACPDPYNADTCQGPYDGAGENYGRAFALMGADANPNMGSMDPRGAVQLDYRYDALVDSGDWHYLVDDDLWLHDVAPLGDKWAMAAVFGAGGYGKVPIPGAVHEPPPPGYLFDYGYCWDTPSPGNCFNYPQAGRQAPYDVVEFLSGADAASLAQTMYDDGNYLGGRYAPGERMIVAVYNGNAETQWGAPGAREDAAVLAGYFGAVIVGYGNDFDSPCLWGIPGLWQSFAPCISGNVNTVYGLALTPLVLDPAELFPPPNRPPAAPAGPAPADGAGGVALTTTLSWAPASDPDGDAVAYDVSFGTVDPPPLVLTGVVTPSFDPGPLLIRTTYYWAVAARDCLTGTAGPTWRFTTGGNHAPDVPHSPNPVDGQWRVPLDAALYWQGGDPDGDPLTYTVALGTSSPPPVVATVYAPQYQPGRLPVGTRYYWSISASDGQASTAGPQWCFVSFGPTLMPLPCGGGALSSR